MKGLKGEVTAATEVTRHIAINKSVYKHWHHFLTLLSKWNPLLTVKFQLLACVVTQTSFKLWRWSIILYIQYCAKVMAFWRNFASRDISLTSRDSSPHFLHTHCLEWRNLSNNNSGLWSFTWQFAPHKSL